VFFNFLSGQDAIVKRRFRHFAFQTGKPKDKIHDVFAVL